MPVTYVRNADGIFTQVGPGGATTDTTLSLAGKPADAAAVSSAINTAMATKVDKIDGMGLSTNDYTDKEKNLLSILGNRPVFVYRSLADLGIETFPTTMHTVAEIMPRTSMLIIDTRRVNGSDTEYSTEPISDWGNDANGTAIIVKGASAARIGMIILHCTTGTSIARMHYGSYAYEADQVNWQNLDAQLESKANEADVSERLAEKVNSTDLAKIMGASYALTTTVTPGDNYSNASGSTLLVGNVLRVHFEITRSSAASGDITNETMATVSIAHGGKIKDGYAVTFGNGTSGHLANMTMSNITCDDTTLSFKVTLTATAGNVTDFKPYFAMPVVIDIDKF